VASNAMNRAQIVRRWSWAGQDRNESITNHRRDRTCTCNAVRSPTLNATTYASVLKPDNSRLLRAPRPAERPPATGGRLPSNRRPRALRNPNAREVARHEAHLRTRLRIAPPNQHAGRKMPNQYEGLMSFLRTIAVRRRVTTGFVGGCVDVPPPLARPMAICPSG